MQSPFTCIYTTKIALILAVTQWCVNSANALKCNGYELESWMGQGTEQLRERQYTLKERAHYVNVQGSVHWECTVCESVDWGAIFFYFMKIDQLGKTKSHMFNTSLKLSNHKYLTAK